MARSPQSFEKRQRERRKAQKRAEKMERRLIRTEEKRLAKEEGRLDGAPVVERSLEGELLDGEEPEEA